MVKIHLFAKKTSYRPRNNSKPILKRIVFNKWFIIFSIIAVIYIFNIDLFAILLALFIF